MLTENERGSRFFAIVACAVALALASACASAPHVPSSAVVPPQQTAPGASASSSSAGSASFNRSEFEKALSGRNLDVLASYSSNEKGTLGAAATPTDRDRAHSRYEALRQEILLVPASQAALAPNLPALVSLLAKPEAKHFTTGERQKLESLLARYASAMSPSDTYRTDRIDPRVARVTSSMLTNATRAPETQLGPLVSALIAGESDQFMKIKLLHDWIAENITYDVAMFSKSTVTNQDLASVLGARRAVCSGYAALFEKMAKIAGFEVKTIHGYTKGLGGDFDFNFQNSHAWNMVKIADLWYLVDTTFDAGAFDSTAGRGKYTKRYSTDYLFAPPVQLRYTHFPENPLEQLSAAPLGKDAFKAQALVTPEYFANGISLKRVAGEAGSILSLSNTLRVANTFSLEFQSPEGTLMDAALFDSKGKEIERSALASHPDSSTWSIDFAAPTGGTFTVRVFAGPREDAGAGSSTMLASVLQFTLQSSAALGSYALPKIYERYQFPAGEFLTSPRSGTLAKGTSAHFAYQSKAKYVAIIYENTFVPLKNIGGDDFALDFKIPATSALKLGVSEDNVHYGIVLAWDVR